MLIIYNCNVGSIKHSKNHEFNGCSNHDIYTGIVRAHGHVVTRERKRSSRSVRPELTGSFRNLNEQVRVHRTWWGLEHKMTFFLILSMVCLAPYSKTYSYIPAPAVVTRFWSDTDQPVVQTMRWLNIWWRLLIPLVMIWIYTSHLYIFRCQVHHVEKSGL